MKEVQEEYFPRGWTVWGLLAGLSQACGGQSVAFGQFHLPAECPGKHELSRLEFRRPFVRMPSKVRYNTGKLGSLSAQSVMLLVLASVLLQQGC